MGLETASFITDLDASNPSSTDSVTQGDDHLRMIKSVLLKCFPDLDRSVKKREMIMPSGAIIMWAGAVDQIPDGYILCDTDRTINNVSGWYDPDDVTLATAGETTSTGIIIPDLADRFILGAGVTTGNTPSATGIDVNVPIGQDGSEHWRAESDFPVAQHTHPFHYEFKEVSDHTHDVPNVPHAGDPKGDSIDITSGSQSGGLDDRMTNGAGGHIPEFISAEIGNRTNLDEDNLLKASMDIKPRYYSLAYIIKY